MILQKDLSGDRLTREIAELVKQPELVSSMETAIRKLARGDAAVAAVNIIEELSRSNVR